LSPGPLDNGDEVIIMITTNRCTTDGPGVKNLRMATFKRLVI